MGQVGPNPLILLCTNTNCHPRPRPHPTPSDTASVHTCRYRMAEAVPGAFVDMASGDNNCTMAHCCTYGFSVSAPTHLCA